MRRSPCQRSWIQPRSTETVSCGFDFTISPMRSSEFGLNLAIRLRHLDHLRGCAVAGHVRHLEAALRGGRRAVGGTGTATAPARLLDPEHLAHHRPHHAHEHDQGEERDHPGLDQPQQVLLGRAEQRGEERRLDGWRRDRRLGKAQVHDLELVAAVLVEPDRGADERGDAVELLLRARLVGRLAAGGPGVDAVEEDRDREPLDAAALEDLGAGGARDLVIDDLLVLVRGVAGRAAAGRLGGSRKLAADADRAVGAARGLVLGPRLGRAHDAALGIEALGAALDAVEVELGRDLHPGPAGADDAGDDLLDLRLAGAARSRPASRRRAMPPAAMSPCAPSASRRPRSSTIETRSGLRPSTAEATRWRTARTCAASSSPLQLQHDRGPRRLAVALEQAALGHDEMDARALDPADRADGARQLALERAEMVDALDEARRGEGVALVEDLVADAAAGRQALAGKLHADAGEVLARDEDGLAVAAGLVADRPARRGPS